MNYKTHIIGGLVAGYASYEIVQSALPHASVGINTAIGMAYIASSVCGSLICDLDKFNISFTGNARNSFLANRLKPIALPISLLFGHRGAFHSPSLHFAITAFLLFLVKLSTHGVLSSTLQSILIGCFIGVISHLILDSFNKKGVPWLFPIVNKNFHLMSLKNGGIVETLIPVLLPAVVIWTLFTK